jgi:hypothetical protein
MFSLTLRHMSSLLIRGLSSTLTAIQSISVLSSEPLYSRNFQTSFWYLFLLTVSTSLLHWVLQWPLNFLGTPIFQPVDVGIQWVIKQFLQQSALNFLVDSHQHQINDGLTPAQVKVTTSLPVLCNALVRPILDLYHFLSSFKGQRIIKQVCLH